jgi:hypothetical protein
LVFLFATQNIKVKIYTSIILPVVLYRFGNWSLILRVEWPRVFENRVPGKIFGPKRDEVTGYWNKLNNDKFYGL